MRSYAWVGLYAVLAVAACAESEELPETFLVAPHWLAATKAPTVSSAEEVLTLWQSEKRNGSDREALFEKAKVLYKACYMAVANDPSNDDLVTQCLVLMSHQMPRDISRVNDRYFIDNYFEYKAHTDNCGNCLPADDLARVSQSYARGISYAGNYKGAVSTLMKVLDERGDEVAPYLQMELYDNIAWYYHKSSFTAGELANLEVAYQRLQPPRDSTGGTLSTYERLRKAIDRLQVE